MCILSVRAEEVWLRGVFCHERSMSKGQAASQLRKLGLKRGKGGAGDVTAAMDSDSGVRSVAG